jgi:hypothetical protein
VEVDCWASDNYASSTVLGRGAERDTPLRPGTNSIQIEVTAQNGVTAARYRIEVTRLRRDNAVLAGIKVELDLGFGYAADTAAAPAGAAARNAAVNSRSSTSTSGSGGGGGRPTVAARTKRRGLNVAEPAAFEGSLRSSRLCPQFRPETRAYSLDIPVGCIGVRLLAIPSDPEAMVVAAHGW